ncbi:MAG: hypothetical protein R3Y28_03665 [Candidatus Gastranaerophilales bacterium]
MAVKKLEKDVNNIIEGLRMNQDPRSIDMLEDVGTNSSVDAIRELTSRALVKKNEYEALKVVVMSKGKGINDMSTQVAMSTINELLSLADKTIAMSVLSEALSEEFDEEIRDNARSVRALMALS